MIGTPNRLEYDQGFFVKLGDGAADVKPIAHLYKTQVYQLAEYLGDPGGGLAAVRRPPTRTRCPQSQDEFYFSLPYEQMDLCLYAQNHGLPPEAVAEPIGVTPERGPAGLRRHRPEAPHDPLPAPRAAARRTGLRRLRKRYSSRARSR